MSNTYEAEFCENFRKRLIKECMGILILAEINKGKIRSGFDFITFFNRRFKVLFSSGTVYSHLYSLERQELIQGKLMSNAMVYSISEKGQKIMDTITRLNLKIQELLKSLSIG